MTLRPFIVFVACGLALASAGCRSAPGKPKAGDDARRPDEVLDFPTLYAENCAACHGEHGRSGAAISLSNPVYLAVAGAANIQRITAAGVPGTAMPPFARSAGGGLTDKQVAVLSQGMVAAWGTPASFSGTTLPPYAASSKGDAAQGQTAFTTFCAGCHGADGNGASFNKTHTGPLVDPAYLSLISDQGLRSILIAGMPDQGMPDWRSDITGPGAHAMTDAEITNIVAWLASHRIATPGQPYGQHP
jgi:mono/diheme cytochrome c family protein